MSQDERVRVALALLRQAGCMDLLRDEALAPGTQGLSRHRSCGYGVFASACWSGVCSGPRRARRGSVTLGGSESEAWSGRPDNVCRMARRTAGGRGSSFGVVWRSGF
ncbi:hypothetical protein NDU88_004162 [Pleurodeles waltl]|uniref:Uncharacterized protein n=1 Tax=Pleurodeles waltl TaxID=8319 RepID=A0AAV7VGA2_PLEWA|nr:hypothetical protein NDU88_004162 [Pleurodeles waltl]